MSRSPEEQVKLAGELADYLQDEYDVDLSPLDLLEGLATFGFEIVRSPEGDAVASAAYQGEANRQHAEVPVTFDGRKVGTAVAVQEDEQGVHVTMQITDPAVIARLSDTVSFFSIPTDDPPRGRG